MKLPKIIHQSDSNISREIILTPFGPFYKTSGTSSPTEIKDTWMPFFYIHEETFGKSQHVRRGGYAKHLCDIFEMRIPHKLVERLMTLFKNVKTDAIPARFATLECLLISSLLGGGMWDRKEGKKLKAFLEATYPLFYKSKPELIISDDTPSIKKDPKAVNDWLMAQAKVKTKEDLIALFPKNLDALILVSNRLNHSITPSITSYYDTTKSLDKIVVTAAIDMPAPAVSTANAVKKRKLEATK